MCLLPNRNDEKLKCVCCQVDVLLAWNYLQHRNVIEKKKKNDCHLNFNTVYCFGWEFLGKDGGGNFQKHQR